MSTKRRRCTTPAARTDWNCGSWPASRPPLTESPRPRLAGISSNRTSGNVSCRSFHTPSCIPLSLITSSSLPSCTATENRVTGVIVCKPRNWKRGRPPFRVYFHGSSPRVRDPGLSPAAPLGYRGHEESIPERVTACPPPLSPTRLPHHQDRAGLGVESRSFWDSASSVAVPLGVSGASVGPPSGLR